MLPWFIVVLFQAINPNTTGQEAYIFLEPKFDTSEECVTWANDPENAQIMIWQMIQEYPEGMQPIDTVVCANQEALHRLLKDKQVKEKGISI
jgi:hypothetical protein